jgi:hypothetical protein
MNQSTKETMDTLARLIEKKAVNAEEALLAAYQLGNFDGQIAMAKSCSTDTKQLLKAA